MSEVMAHSQEGSQEQIDFKHAVAEDTRGEGGSADLVSACLLLHEVPTQGIRAITAEAFRLLRPGGTLAIMVPPPPFSQIPPPPSTFASPLHRSDGSRR